MDSSGLWRGAGTWLDSLRGRGGARRGASWLCTVLACSVLMLTVVGGALSSRPAFQVPCCLLPWLGPPGNRAVPPALVVYALDLTAACRGRFTRLSSS